MNYVVIHHFLRQDINEEMMKPHVDYLKQLFDNGKLVITGPFTDKNRGGMFILEVENEAELHQIVNNDPAIIKSYARSEVRPYKIVFERKK
jgi:uncharacterized protein YciI